ncbi:MAG: hypothetical protein P8Z37_09295 [Acidobacteriota bacterium]
MSLKAGARKEMKIKKEGERYTALDLVGIQGHAEIVKLLKEYGAKE